MCFMSPFILASGAPSRTRFSIFMSSFFATDAAILPPIERPASRYTLPPSSSLMYSWILAASSVTEVNTVFSFSVWPSSSGTTTKYLLLNLSIAVFQICHGVSTPCISTTALFSLFPNVWKIISVPFRPS